MNIVVSLKVVPDDQDIQVLDDGGLDASKAHRIVSAYDLNAIEAAAQLVATEEGSTLRAITVGGSDIDDSKTKKNILARGVDELIMVADDACVDLDAYATASVLADVLADMGEWDLIVCGDGSADNYAQQVDVQLAARLGIPSVNGVTEIKTQDGHIVVKRMLEDALEVAEVPLPAIVAVSPDIALPCIPGMKDILTAGKKPMNVIGVSSTYESANSVISRKAPEQTPRMRNISDVSESGAIEKFAAAIKAAL